MKSPAKLQLPEVPDAFLARLAELARTRFGRAAPEGAVLAAAVQEVSRRYTRDRAALSESLGEPLSLTARLRFYLPRDLYKIWGPLSELRLAGQLPRRKELRVLDVGAGLGTTTLGMATFAAAYDLCDELQVLALDSDAETLSLMEALLAEPRGLSIPPLKLKTERLRLQVDAAVPRGPFDLVLCGLALNEVLLPLEETMRPAAGAAILRALSGRLTDDGCLIVLEPALREESRCLEQIRDLLSASDQGPHVFAPCLGSAPCPMLERARDWCHERLPARLPGELGELSRAAGLRDEELTYSYLTLRRQAGSLAQLETAPMGHPYRVVGGPVRSKGKVEYDLCGLAGGRRLLQLDRHRRSGDDPLQRAARGTILSLDGAGAGEERTRLRLTPEVRVETLLSWTQAVQDPPARK